MLVVTLGSGSPPRGDPRHFLRLPAGIDRRRSGDRRWLLASALVHARSRSDALASGVYDVPTGTPRNKRTRRRLEVPTQGRCTLSYSHHPVCSATRRSNRSHRPTGSRQWPTHWRSRGRERFAALDIAKQERDRPHQILRAESRSEDKEVQEPLPPSDRSGWSASIPTTRSAALPG